MISVRLLILLFTHVLVTQATSLFVKHYNQKIVSNQITSVHAVKGVLYCEKLCLDMGDACDAANVIHINGKYECEVMADFPYSGTEVKNRLADNPRGKLIIKQDFNVCAGITCFNGGTCINRSTGYSCICVYGYYDTHCESEWIEETQIRGSTMNFNFTTMGLISGQQFLVIAGISSIDIIIDLTMDKIDLTVTQSKYEVVLDGWDKTKSAIRFMSFGENKAISTISNLLSEEEFRYFWFSWFNATIRVGTGKSVGEAEIMSCLDSNGVEPTYVAFSGFRTSVGHIKLSRALNPCFLLLTDVATPCGDVGIAHDDCLGLECCWNYRNGTCYSSVALALDH